MKIDIHYLFSAKYAKWIIIGLISVFSVLIIITYARLFFINIPPVAESKGLTLPQGNQNASNYLLNSALFGVYVSNDLNDDNIKKSRLNVTVVGILLGDKAELSQVIIRAANGEEKSYKIDDTIPGGALVKRIMEGGVLVERDGSLESLSLPKNELMFEPAAKPLSSTEE